MFVIEVKNWSREFAESPDHFNQFEQVARASYVCHDLLRSRNCDVPVKSIIGCRGRLFQKEKGGPAKVPRLHEMNGYIKWFPRTLEPSKVQEIKDFLSRYVR